MTTTSPVESIAGRTIKAYSLIKTGQRIGVALSGDDSYGVLLCLSGLVPSENLVAITVLESVETSRPEEVAVCREIAADLGVTHVVVSFEEIYGLSLEELAATLEGLGGPPAPGGERSIPVCAVCIGLRNDALALAAVGLGLDVVADGYNADDWVGNLLRGFLFGAPFSDPPELATAMPFAVKRKEGRVLKISPFSFVRKRDIQAYVDDYKPRPFPVYRCAHAALLHRSEIRRVLRLVDEIWPDALVGVAARGLEPFAQRQPCRHCGVLAPANPTVSRCRVCWAIDSLGVRVKTGEADTSEDKGTREARP